MYIVSDRRAVTSIGKENLWKLIFCGNMEEGGAVICYISQVLVERQRRYEKNKKVLECFHLIRTLRDECGWSKE